MLLRRMIQHLRRQEWTAIAIDFVIVVVGVFLATQVTNWNEARITREFTDPELREAATLLFNSDLIDNAAHISRASEYRNVFRRSVPAAVQLALRTHCGDRAAEGGFPTTIDYPCSIGLPAGEVSAAAAALRRSPGFIAALRQRVADLDTIREDLSIGDGELNALVDHYAALTAE